MSKPNQTKKNKSLKINRLKDEDMELQQLQHKLNVPGTHGRTISEKVEFLMKDIDQFHFPLNIYDPREIIKMTKDEVLTHLYHILLNFIDTTNDDITLSKIFVLYGVKLYEQKKPVHNF